jgi:hypothetical protein
MTVTPRMATLTLLGTLAYLGLAVLGWGGVTAFFSHPALIALAVTTLLLSGLALFSGGCLRAYRATCGLFAGLHRPNWVLDARRRHHSLDRRRSLRRWGRASQNLALSDVADRVGSLEEIGGANVPIGGCNERQGI